VSTLTRVFSINAADTLVYPETQWLDESNNTISIDSTNYSAIFSLLYESTLSAYIIQKTQTTAVHWLDSTSYTLVSGVTDTIYIDDNAYRYINSDTLIQIDNELMQVVGVGIWDSVNNRLPLTVVRGWYDLNTAIYNNIITHDTMDLINDITRDWKGIIFEQYNDTTATSWDATVWSDMSILESYGVPSVIYEKVFTSQLDDSHTSHAKGTDVIIYMLYNDLANIDEVSDTVYYQWKNTPIAPPGQYKCIFRLSDLVDGGVISLPNTAGVCGAARCLVLDVWGY
jgi:hypothetical protein